MAETLAETAKIAYVPAASNLFVYFRSSPAHPEHLKLVIC